jgi:hypothetical protein
MDMPKKHTRALTLGLSVLSCGLISCQEPVRLSNAGVRMTAITEIGPDDHLLFISEVAVDSRGYIYAAPVATRGTVAKYAPDGSLIGLVGREGGGPGELRDVSSIFVWPGDTLAVVGWGTLSLFSPAGEFTRSVALNGLVRVAYVRGDTVRLLNDPERGIGVPPISVFAAGSTEQGREDVDVSGAYFMAHDGAAYLLGGRRSEAVTRVRGDGSGRQEHSLGLPWVGDQRLNGGVKSGGFIAGLTVSGDTLWVLATREVPVDERAATAGRQSGPVGPRPASVADRMEKFEGTVVVYQLPSFRRIAAAKWPGRLVSGIAIGPSVRYYTFGEATDGSPTIQLWAPATGAVQH